MSTPHLWLFIVRVINLLPFVPVFRLLCIWILDLLWGQKVPIILQRSRLHLLVVDLHLICVVWINEERVQMGVFIILVINITGLVGSLRAPPSKSKTKHGISLLGISWRADFTLHLMSLLIK